MPEKKYYSPQEAVDYLNNKFNLGLNVTRLARLRREKRIKGEKIGGTNTSVYTHKALDMVTVTDIQDKRTKEIMREGGMKGWKEHVDKERMEEKEDTQPRKAAGGQEQ